MDLKAITDQGVSMAIQYAPKVLLALLTLIIGFWVIKKIIKFAEYGFASSGIDESLSKFLASLLSIALKIMLFLSVAGMFGVNTTSFIAIFSALMIGVGMALNGTLGHAAAGVMIMIFKPFKIGEGGT